MLAINVEDLNHKLSVEVVDFVNEAYNVLPKKQKRYLDRYGVYIECVPCNVIGYGTNVYTTYVKEHTKYLIVIRMSRDWRFNILHELSHVLSKHCTGKNMERKLNQKEEDCMDVKAEKWLLAIKKSEKHAKN